MKTLRHLLFILITTWLLQSCSGEGFHLRGHGNLPAIQEAFYIEGINLQTPFGSVLRNALNQSGSKVVQDPDQASVLLTISNLVEDKTAAGYSRARKVREYDIFIRMNYSFRNANGHDSLKAGGNSINLTRTQLYDSEFALGKAEEEKTIQRELEQKAAQLILLKLQYSHKNKEELKK